MNELPPRLPFDRPSMFGRVRELVSVGSPITKGLLWTVGIALLVFALAFAVQTVRLEGARFKIPIVGEFGPHGWKPWAEAMQDIAVTRTQQRNQANANHRQTKANFRNAAQKAQEAHNAEIATITANHNRTVETIRIDLRRARSDVRDIASRLRREQAIRAGSSVDGGAGEMPASRLAGAEFDYEPTGCYGVPGQRSAIEQIDCSVLAQDNTDQLIRLQALIRTMPGFREVSDEEFDRLISQEGQ